MNKNRRVIKTRWPLDECMTVSPSQWRHRETVVWLVLGGWPELLLIGREQLPKRDQNATASTATSNVSSSCDYRTMPCLFINGNQHWDNTFDWEISDAHHCKTKSWVPKTDTLATMMPVGEKIVCPCRANIYLQRILNIMALSFLLTSPNSFLFFTARAVSGNGPGMLLRVVHGPHMVPWEGTLVLFLLNYAKSSVHLLNVVH